MPLLAALVSGLAFTLLQILFKRHTSPATSPLILPSWLALLFPAWLAAFVACNQTNLLTFTLTPTALAYPLLWAICTVTTTTGLVWLLSRFSLSELAGYKKTFITLGAATADVLIFHTQFPLATLIALAFLLGGTVGLSQSRNRLPTLAEIALIIGWCLIMVFQVSTYKYGQKLQPAVLSHTIIAQGFSTALYALLWLIPTVRRQPLPGTGVLVPVLAAALTGVLLEGFAYAGLPLAMVLVITMLPTALMATHDLWHGDLPRTPRTALALLILLAGIVTLVWR